MVKIVIRTAVCAVIEDSGTDQTSNNELMLQLRLMYEYECTYDAVIAGSFVATSALDIERVDLATPFHCLFQLLFSFVHVPISSLQKPQQSARIQPLKHQ